MNLLNSIYKNKNNLGKIFFAISICIFLYMFISPISNVYIHMDERFTTYLISLPLNELWQLIVYDVHPPLYYFILIALEYPLKMLNISNDIIYLSKIVSMIPYLLILLVSFLKIRKDYDWFVAGLFTFVLGTLTNFYIQFLTIRMYGWGLLFLLLTFIYLKDIIEKSDLKSWILFTVFSILGAYTHNIVLISLGFVYLTLLFYIYRNDDSEYDKMDDMRKWFISAVAMFISYLPWLFTLITQTASNHGNGNYEMTIYKFINYFTGFGIYEGSKSISSILDPTLWFSIITLIILILTVFFAIRKYQLKKSKKNSYLILGISIFIITILFGIFVLPMFFGLLNVRYLIPVYAIVWFVTIILLDTIHHRKLFAIFLALILVLCCFGVAESTYESNKLKETGDFEQTILNKIDNNDSIVLYRYRFEYYCYHNEVSNTKEYGLDDMDPVRVDELIIEQNLTKILKENPDKNVYVVKAIRKNENNTFGDNIKVEKYGNKKNPTVLKLKLKKQDNNY